MVATILIGCVKLGYTRWQLRKYTVLAEQEKKEQSLARQMSQRRGKAYGTSKEEIPFGIRALESGIEVDGVWVSRPNTPESHCRESSATSVGLKQPNRTSFDYDIERQQHRISDRPPAKSTSSAPSATHTHTRRRFASSPRAPSRAPRHIRTATRTATRSGRPPTSLASSRTASRSRPSTCASTQTG